MKKRVLLQNTDDRGFTLIELMVVIVILGILAGLIVPRIMGRPEEAKRLKARMQIETEQGLQALVEKPDSGRIPKNWKNGGYFEKGRLPKDPWHNDFIYLSPGVHGDFDISSYGADGVPGGEGKNSDINNWEIE